MADDLTIDELAQRTGMTVRNIRAHQSRGLLPPPRLRGRTGLYGADHVARIELIRGLQSEGFNLEGIRRLIDGAGEGSEAMLRFTQTLRAPFQETGREVPLQEIVERMGSEDPALLERAFKLGLLRPLGDGWVEETSPTLARAGAELRALGVPPGTALDLVETMRRASDRVAKAFVDLFLEQVWKPFDTAGRPAERWAEVQDSLDRLRPLAAEAVDATFRMVMTERVDKAFGEEYEPTRK
ncbi:MAG: hypothetical protein QOF76_536 [Solirubrobacteraceae bacterium]|nr:hypothetical protein [Solirubrobacteraceae bacterium]